jgi:hypothetical protein
VKFMTRTREVVRVVALVALVPGVLLLEPQVNVAQAAAAACNESGDTHIWWSPETPAAGQSLRLIAVHPAGGEATLVDASEKKPAPIATIRRAGPPPSYAGEVGNLRAGNRRIELRAGNKLLACRSIEVVAKGKDRPRRAVTDVFWKNTRAWDRDTEGFFAAWVESLFDAPTGEALSFRPLAPALRDPKRNFLFDHLALGEDDPKNKEVLRAEPDCADLPYFLRAYFAWKMGLPMGFRDCNRGSSTAAPTCGTLFTNSEPAEGKTTLGVMRTFLRKLGNTVHSGSARTALGDDATDLYPVPLDRAAMRPGTVYADPYGHVLLLVKWVPAEKGAGGLLFAVDGQPDGSVGRKRFWEGTFLFTSGDKSAGPGWKAFRPLVAAEASADAPAAAPTQLNNEALSKPAGSKPAFAPFSREQETLATDAFYARMAKLINPAGLPPKLAYEETLAALVEQLQTRVGSVDNGEVYAKQSKNAVIEMPEGPKIFETIGPWEDFATPSRDMRLIIAMKVLAGVGEKIEKHPDLFVLAGKSAAAARKEIEALHAQQTQERSIEYKRSDGSVQKLTVAELLGRRAGFEVAYNPNDCVEYRWGAPAGSPEMTTCTRRAPAAQQSRMEEYRPWFRDARRPPR